LEGGRRRERQQQIKTGDEEMGPPEGEGLGRKGGLGTRGETKKTKERI